MLTATAVREPNALSEAVTPEELLERILAEMEVNTLPVPSRNALVRVAVPGVGEITDAKVTGQLERIGVDLAADGPTPFTRGELDALEEQLIAHMVRVQAISDVLAADAGFVTKAGAEQQAALTAEATRLRQVQTAAWRDGLNATHTQREGICTLVAMLDLSLCDGKAGKVFWVNADPFATPDTKARGEGSFRDMPDDQKVGNAWPFIESAVGPDGQPLAVTLVPMADKLVFQTAGRVVVLGGDAPACSTWNGGRTS